MHADRLNERHAGCHREQCRGREPGRQSDLQLTDHQRHGARESAANGNRFIRTSGLTIGATAGLNLADNDLIFQSTAGTKAADLLTFFNLIKLGLAGGLWNGVGISSSAAAADPLRITTLGLIVNDNGAGGVIRGTLDAQSVDINTILVKYTYTGDTDLDGDIDADDYARIDGGFAAHLSGYRNGDLNFSGGSPNSDDYFQIDKAFYNQGAALSDAVSAATDAGVCGVVHHRLADSDEKGNEEAGEACGCVGEYNTDISAKAHKPKKKHWSDRFQF